MNELHPGTVSGDTLLEVRRLSVCYTGGPASRRAVRDLSLRIAFGETLALVGETGSGKSTVAHALVGLLGLADASGEVLLQGENLLGLKESRWRRIRGRKIGIVFQDARGALNPVMTVGAQMVGALGAHRRIGRKEARGEAVRLLAEVGIGDPESYLRRYPLELSGGLCQRVGIALGIAHSPLLLIADEPTSALDPGIQERILGVLAEMKRRYGLALLLISHDLALVSKIADRIAVMYHGRIVETGGAERISSSPAHPYTRLLFECRPGLEHHRDLRPLVSIEGPPPAPECELPGCPFAPRCPDADEECVRVLPVLQSIAGDHGSSCRKSAGEHSDATASRAL